MTQLGESMKRRQFLKRSALAGGAAAALSSGSAQAAPLPPTTDATHLSHFGFMFPQLPPQDFGTDVPTTLANLHTLAESMREDTVPAIAANPDDPDFDTNIGAGMTYYGQGIIDHDLIKDPTPPPTTFFGRNQQGLLLDPKGATIGSEETNLFDLSVMYAGGPEHFPAAYDGAKFIVQRGRIQDVPGIPFRDLQRDASGVAVLPDGRNEENQLVGQMHLAFQMFHNAVVGLGHGFEAARRIVLQHHQWALLHDFLPTLAGQQVVNGFLNGSIRRFYRPGVVPNPYTPLEVMGAAYRLHTMIRNDYELNNAENAANIQHDIFDVGSPEDDLHGGRPLFGLLTNGVTRQIDFGNFFTDLARADNISTGSQQFARKFDTLMSSGSGDNNGIFALPIGGPFGAEVSGLTSLPERNMSRMFFYGLASGQQLARAMGLPVIHPEDAIDPHKVPGFTRATPPFYYMNLEAERAGGMKLGPMQARLILDMFTRLLEIDPNGILNPRVRFRPDPKIMPNGTIADILVFAGVATRP
jgi:hypothetical protein